MYTSRARTQRCASAGVEGCVRGCMVGKIACRIERVGGEIALRAKGFWVSDTSGDAVIYWARCATGLVVESKMDMKKRNGLDVNI